MNTNSVKADLVTHAIQHSRMCDKATRTLGYYNRWKLCRITERVVIHNQGGTDHMAFERGVITIADPNAVKIGPMGDHFMAYDHSGVIMAVRSKIVEWLE